jgi:hypothetical protein
MACNDVALLLVTLKPMQMLMDAGASALSVTNT